MTQVSGEVAARPDAGPLPALLGAIAEHLAVATIDEVWIFPPHRVGKAESVVAVVSAFGEDDDRRRIFTARCTVVREPKGPGGVEREVAEQGRAPAERLGRLIEGVLRRLGDEWPAAPPQQVRVGGDAARWEALLEGTAG